MPKVNYPPDRIYRAIGIDRPRQWQLNFLENDDVDILIGERLTGKTTALMAKVIDKALDASVRNRVDVAFVCQTRHQVERVRKRITDALNGITIATSTMYNTISNDKLSVAGGAFVIDFYDMGQESQFFGKKYDLVILDECKILDDMHYVYYLGDRRIESRLGTKLKNTIWVET